MTIAAIALIAIAFIVGDLASRRPVAAKTTAEVIADARDRHRILTTEDSGDDALPGAERNAGEMWAKAHHIQGAADCPAYSVEFRDGCADAVAASRR